MHRRSPAVDRALLILAPLVAFVALGSCGRIAHRDPAALVPVLGALRDAGYPRAVSIEMKRAPEGLAAVRRAVANLAAARDAMEAAHA